MLARSPYIRVPIIHADILDDALCPVSQQTTHPQGDHCPNFYRLQGY
jgi:hypothetical protein